MEGSDNAVLMSIMEREKGGEGMIEKQSDKTANQM